jgi:flagellin
MSSIITNVNAMAAIRSLSMITNNMAKTQAAVESGLRINKANDNPAVFAIAQTMRADLKAMTAVSDALAFGKATLTVARDAATKISNELSKLKETVLQARQQGLDRGTLQAQVQNLLNNIRSFAETATFNGVNLLDNSASGDRELRVLRDITGKTFDVANQKIIIPETADRSRLLNLQNLDVDQGGIRLTPPAGVNPEDGNFVVVRFTDGREFVFEFNRQTDDTSTPNEDERNLTTTAGANRTVIEVNIGDTGSELTPTNELGRLVDAMRANGIGARLNNDGTLDILAADLDMVAFSIEAGPGSSDDMTGAIRKTATGWQYGTYDVATQTFTAGAGAGQYAQVIGGTPDNGTFDSSTADVTGASSAIAVVDEAITTVNRIVATLGARLSQIEGQQEFTKQLTDSLKEGLGALVDADLAEESGRLASLQTRQQLAIQSLSIANQQSQALLGLFR